MGHGYAVIYDIIGEIVVWNKETGVFVWELRPDIKRYEVLDPSRSSLTGHDQPALHEVASWYEEFWTSGEPLPLANGLYAGPGQRLEVLKVKLDDERLQVTLRPLGVGN